MARREHVSVNKLVTVKSRCVRCKKPTQMAFCDTCNDVFMEGCEPGCDYENLNHHTHSVIRESDLVTTEKG